MANYGGDHVHCTWYSGLYGSSVCVFVMLAVFQLLTHACRYCWKTKPHSLSLFWRLCRRAEDFGTYVGSFLCMYMCMCVCAGVYVHLHVHMLVVYTFACTCAYMHVVLLFATSTCLPPSVLPNATCLCHGQWGQWVWLWWAHQHWSVCPGLGQVSLIISPHHLNMSACACTCVCKCMCMCMFACVCICTCSHFIHKLIFLTECSWLA